MVWLPIAALWFVGHPPPGAALSLAVACGLLSSLVPYAADPAALRRVPAAVFGTFTSINPVWAALAGHVLSRTLVAGAVGGGERPVRIRTGSGRAHDGRRADPGSRAIGGHLDAWFQVDISAVIQPPMALPTIIRSDRARSAWLAGAGPDAG